jgi:hypothetical protein
MSGETTRDLAVEAVTKIDNHIESCDRRYGEIDRHLALLVRIVGWGGATAFGITLSLLGYTASKLVDYIAKTAV